jgi:hypothetical protein
MRNGKDFRREKNAEAYEVSDNVTAGRNSVRELLASGRDIDKILVSDGHKEGSINE